MPRWILNRPEEHAHPSELRVARALQSLGPEWLVRWGYYYKDNRGHLREGDFLVLGPRGGLLVLEVKGGDIRSFPFTGDWHNDILSNGDHPLHQLLQEWAAVRRDLTGAGLYCQFALCLPDLTIPESAPTGWWTSWKRLGCTRRSLSGIRWAARLRFAWRHATPDTWPGWV